MYSATSPSSRDNYLIPQKCNHRNPISHDLPSSFNAQTASRLVQHHLQLLLPLLLLQYNFVYTTDSLLFAVRPRSSSRSPPPPLNTSRPFQVQRGAKATNTALRHPRRTRNSFKKRRDSCIIVLVTLACVLFFRLTHIFNEARDTETNTEQLVPCRHRPLNTISSPQW